MNDPTPPNQQVISALVVEQFVRLAKSRGLDTEGLLKGAAVTEEQLATPNLQLPFIPVQLQLRRTVEQLQDPLIGLHVSALINLATLGVLGYLLQTSSTLQNLIDLTIRFDDMLSNLGRTWLRQESNTTLWGWDCYIEDELVERHAVDCITAYRATLMISLLKRKTPLPLLGVRLRHGPPRELQLLREYEDFFCCPVQFNQPESALLIASDALQEPLSLADPEVHKTLEEHARLLLSKRSNNLSLSDRVRSALRRHLAQHVAPTREELAEELGMSGRTLHRKLQDVGSSFHDILDEIRLELAQDYLRGSALKVEEIAQRLGFQESQSFIRCFRQLANTTPGEFRQQLLNMISP